MSGAQELNKKEKDILRLVHSECHLGNTNCNKQMERFVHHTTSEGVPIFNLEDTYNKIRLAARIIAGQSNMEDVIVVSSRDLGQRAVIKFATFTGASATSNARWTPGVLTNHNTKQFKEPRLMIVVDTYADRKAIIEASYMNIPVIALTNTDSNLQFVDVAIPCNNKSTQSISMIFWLLAREVRVLNGQLKKDDDWDVMVDLFYYKTEKEQEKNEKDAAVKVDNEHKDDTNWDQNKNQDDDWATPME
jgi:small subunit ribosomal protein SAe